MIQILPVHDQVYRECNLVLPNRPRQFDLVRVCLSARDPVRRIFPRILKADLDVIKTRINQHLQSLLIESDARGDEIRIESRSARGRD